LLKKLKHTTFKFGTKVTAIKNGEITIEGTAKLESHCTIIATDAGNLVANLKNQSIQWRSCTTFYFEVEKRIIKKSLIGLIPKSETVINNIFYHTSLSSASSSSKELLSVTIVETQGLLNEVLLERVERELKTYCGIDSCRFIKQYSIPMALPKLHDIQYEMLPSETRLTTTIFLAGDTQLNGSLNAAIVSGEKAALGVVEMLKGTTS
jgi:hypothetical protein